MATGSGEVQEAASPSPPGGSWLTPKAEVRSTPLGGLGVFAREDIPQHELVVFWSGRAITFTQLLALPIPLRNHSVQVWFDTWLAPGSEEEIDAASKINHSCEPNCGVKGSAAVVSRRLIRAGEELTYDYATTDTIYLYMTCKCGTPSCRGIIKWHDWKNATFRERNHGYLSYYIYELEKFLRDEETVGLPPGGVSDWRRGHWSVE